MSEYDHSRAPAQAPGTSAGAAYEAPPRTAQERARDTIVGADRELGAVEHDAASLAQAAAQNDRGAWDRARARFGSAIAHARVATEKARATAPDGRTAEIDTQLANMEQRLAALMQTNDRAVPPKGYTPVSREDEILEAVLDKPGGSAKLGFAAKEHALKGLFDQLDPAESRALLARIHKPVPGDPLAAAFNTASHLAADRRRRLVTFLEGARARDARRVAPPPPVSGSAAAPTSLVTPALTTAAPAADVSPAPLADRADHVRPGLTRRKTAPTGTVLVSVSVSLDAIPLPRRPPVSPGIASVRATLRVDGDALSIDLAAGDDHWVAALSAEQLVRELVGNHPEIAARVPTSKLLTNLLAKRPTAIGSRVRIELWGAAATQDESFVVLDLADLVGGLQSGSLDGLRPVEAQLQLGHLAGLQVFANDQVKAATAIPGAPIGEWFQVPDHGPLLGVLGHRATEVWAGVFYAGHQVSVAIKPSATALTGIVTHLDLAVLVEKLHGLGAKAGGWLAKLLARIEAGGEKVLDMIGGALRFRVPGLGSWIDFDLKLQLPRLWSGGGFDLSALVPTGFHFELGGLSLGALPRSLFTWLNRPRQGSFAVPWEKLAHLLDGLRDLKRPARPALDFGLHWISGMRLGLGLDLGAVWPELGDLALGFEIDLETIAAKLGAAGHWVTDKARAGAAFAERWLHLEADGMLRIYDRTNPTGNLVGFQLERLLDGAEPSDLVPTELRFTEGAAADKAGGPALAIEMGEVGVAGTAGPTAGRAAPQRPGGLVLAHQDQLAVPAQVAQALALPADAQLDVALYLEAGDRLSVWAEAPSTQHARPQAVKTTVSLDVVGDVVKRHWPAGKPKPSGRPSIALDQTRSKAANAAWFEIGAADPLTVGAVGAAGAVHGHVSWSLAQLVGAQDVAALSPTTFELRVDGVGGVQLGLLPAEARGARRLSVPAPALRHGLLHAPDGSDVWLGVHHMGDLVGASITSEETGETGALATVSLTFLLQQLERLGDFGHGLLAKLAALAEVPLEAGAALGRLAAKLGADFLQLVNGALSFRFPRSGHHVTWNLALHLPHLGLDFDFSNLIPEFDLPMPHLPSLSLALQASARFAGKLLGSFHVPDLGGLLDGMPGLHLPSPIGIDVAWIDDLLGISVDLSKLGDLFGPVPMSFGFHLPIKALLAKVQAGTAWLGSHLQKVASLQEYVHLGRDGVLRIYAPGRPDGDRVGFDLKALFGGLAVDELVPVELHVEVDAKAKGGRPGAALAELSYGEVQSSTPDAAAPAGKQPDGKVLVARPTGLRIETTELAAPTWLRGHLGVAPGATIEASLYVTRDTAIAFATVRGSDRGIALTIHAAVLAQLEHGAGKLAPQGPAGGASTPQTSAPVIDAQTSLERGLLVVSFGGPRAAGAEHMHGHVGWRVGKLLANPSLEDLVPDELEIDRREGRLTLSQQIDLAALKSRGLQRVGSIPAAGLAWASDALGLARAVEVWATHDFQTDARFALVAPGAPDAATAPGVELDLHHELVVLLAARLRHLAHEASGAIRAALPNTRGAGALSLGAALGVVPTLAGIQITHGAATDADYMYATFSWAHVAGVLDGDATLEALRPDALRVATKSIAIEMAQAPVTQPPGASHVVTALHPLLADALHGVGLAATDWIDLDLTRSKVTDGKTQRMALVATVYHTPAPGAREQVHVTSVETIRLAIDASAVLAQLLPNRHWGKDAADPKAGQTQFGASIDATHDLAGHGEGLELAVDVKHRTGAGDLREVKLTAGWTLQQLLDVLLTAAEPTRPGAPSVATGLLPTELVGSFATDNFALTFGTGGQHSEYNTRAAEVPGISHVVAALLTKQQAETAVLNLDIPDRKAFLARVKDAFATHGMIVIAGCSLEVPGAAGAPPRFYGVELSLSLFLLKKVLYLVPVAGELIALIDMIYSAAKDPKGTLETMAYTPALLVDFVELAPDLYASLKPLGWKGVAMALVMESDGTTKQSVMAARIYKKLTAAGWKKGELTVAKMAGAEVPPAPYLEWLSQQDGAALKKFLDYGETMKTAGIDVGEAPDWTVPAAPLSTAAIDLKIDLLAHGYESFAAAKQHADETKDPSEEQALRVQAEALRLQTATLLHGGARASATADAVESKQARAIDTTAVAIFDLSQLPAPSPEQDASARRLFAADGEGRVLSREHADYWVQKFAPLSVDQLAQLLGAGVTSVATPTGSVAVPLFAEERPFVRALFARRAGIKPTAGADEPLVGAAADAAAAEADAKLVAGWRATPQAHASKPAKGGTAGRARAETWAAEPDSLDGLEDSFGAGDAGPSQGPDANRKVGTDHPTQAKIDAADGAGHGAGQATAKPDPFTIKPSARGFDRLVKLDGDTVRLDPEVAAEWDNVQSTDTGALMDLHGVSIGRQGVVGAGEAKRILFTLVVRISYAGTTADYAHEYTLHPSTGRHEETHWSDADDLGATVRKHLVISGKQFAVGPDPRFSYDGIHLLIRDLGPTVDSRGVTVHDVNSPRSDGLIVALELLVENGHGAFTTIDGYHEIRPGLRLNLSVKINR